MHLLDHIREAREGDIVAASSTYRISKRGRMKGPADARAWVITPHGVEPVSIFKIKPSRLPVASISMIHSQQDPVLQALGRSLVDIMGPGSFLEAGRHIDLVNLCNGIVALRRLPDLTRSSGDHAFKEALPKIVTPFVDENLSHDKQASVSFDLSVFLSKVCSTRPRFHTEIGQEDPVPPTTITITPPT